jgi:aryl-alcohol dehydrogenase-like predicted oxidoreductase
MKTRNLGSSGLKVTNLCLGTMTLGPADAKSFMHNVAADEETSFLIYERAVEAGINFFDTADVYGQDGLTERVLGKWLSTARNRDGLVLATKFRFRTGEGANDTGASRRHIMMACDQSLRRLRTDRIDLYQIHMQDMETPEEETLRALDDLVRSGKVLYVGCSNYTAYRMVDAVWTSRHHGLNRYVSLQANYSLMQRDLEREHVSVCRRFGIGLLPYAPLAAGFLTGKFRRDEPPEPGTRLEKFRDRFSSFDNDRGWGILDVVREAAKALGTTPSAVSLAWLLTKPYVSSVVFGARTVEQLDDNLAASELVIPPEWVDKLDKASSVEMGYPYDWMKRQLGEW